jgi:hypothetical protein
MEGPSAYSAHPNDRINRHDVPASAPTISRRPRQHQQQPRISVPSSLSTTSVSPSPTSLSSSDQLRSMATDQGVRDAWAAAIAAAGMSAPQSLKQQQSVSSKQPQQRAPPPPPPPPQQLMMTSGAILQAAVLRPAPPMTRPSSNIRAFPPGNGPGTPRTPTTPLSASSSSSSSSIPKSASNDGPTLSVSRSDVRHHRIGGGNKVPTDHNINDSHQSPSGIPTIRRSSVSNVTPRIPVPTLPHNIDSDSEPMTPKPVPPSHPPPSTAPASSSSSMSHLDDEPLFDKVQMAIRELAAIKKSNYRSSPNDSATTPRPSFSAASSSDRRSSITSNISFHDHNGRSRTRAGSASVWARPSSATSGDSKAELSMVQAVMKRLYRKNVELSNQLKLMKVNNNTNTTTDNLTAETPRSVTSVTAPTTITATPSSSSMSSSMMGSTSSPPSPSLPPGLTEAWTTASPAPHRHFSLHGTGASLGDTPSSPMSNAASNLLPPSPNNAHSPSRLILHEATPSPRLSSTTPSLFASTTTATPPIPTTSAGRGFPPSHTSAAVSAPARAHMQFLLSQRDRTITQLRKQLETCQQQIGHLEKQLKQAIITARGKYGTTSMFDSIWLIAILCLCRTRETSNVIIGW